MLKESILLSIIKKHVPALNLDKAIIVEKTLMQDYYEPVLTVSIGWLRTNESSLTGLREITLEIILDTEDIKTLYGLGC